MSDVWFRSDELRKILGTSSMKPYWGGNHNVRAGYALQLVYVYCDLVEHITVGDSLVPCLRTVPVSTDDKEHTWLRFENPHYVPILKNDCSTVEIELANDEGKEIRFGAGLSLFKLDFRPRKGI
jgi:hypothetical protein